MGVNIHVPADEVWSFFQKNKDRLEKEMVAIAENDDTDYAVYLTEDYGYPTFFVCKGDAEPEYEEGAISADDCLKTARKCYSQYLFPVSVCSQKSFQEDDDNDENEIEDNSQEIQDIMYEREDELRMALCDFLQVVLLVCLPQRLREAKLRRIARPASPLFSGWNWQPNTPASTSCTAASTGAP